MSKSRCITALLGLTFIALLLFVLPPVWLIGVVAACILVGAWEWSALCDIDYSAARYVYVVMIAAGLALTYFLAALPVLWVAAVVWVYAAAVVLCYARKLTPCGFQYPAIRAVFGYVCLLAFWVALLHLRFSIFRFGEIRLTMAMLVVFAADTGGYVVGKCFGRRHFIPRVSPNKTWAGFWGGLLSAVCVAVVPTFFFNATVEQRWMMCAVGVAVGLAAVIGDLLVSTVKRIAGVKDTGQILPGHGGIMDRLDSLTAGCVFYALGMMLMGS